MCVCVCLCSVGAEEVLAAAQATLGDIQQSRSHYEETPQEAEIYQDWPRYGQGTQGTFSFNSA